MRCPRCREDTRVVDCRLRGGNMKRRRECVSCGERFNTWETRRRPDTRDRSAYFAARYAAQSPEAKRRAALRRAARQEAKETGEAVEAIYQRWGVG